jgi:hypothetical protein
MVLGDVSGKGMPASLLMMGLQARVQVLIEEPKSLAEVMTRLNRITSANCPSNRFITLFFCILDGDTGELTFCNAGHNPPLIVRANGEHEQLPAAVRCSGFCRSSNTRNIAREARRRRRARDLQRRRHRSRQSRRRRVRNRGPVGRRDPGSHRCRLDDCRPISTRRWLAYTAGAPPSDDITVIVARRVP